jgi:hypothetical protein
VGQLQRQREGHNFDYQIDANPSDNGFNCRACDFVKACRPTIKAGIPGAWGYPAHHVLYPPMGSEMFVEGMRIQDTSNDARMLVFCGCWEPLQEWQEEGLECSRRYINKY